MEELTNTVESTITKIISSSFDYRDASYDPYIMYIDLDSCLSILTSDLMPDDKMVTKVIISSAIYIIANYLTAWRNRTNIKMYYSFKPTKKFNEYIPDWNIERNKRLNEENVKLIYSQIISRLKRLKLNNISLIECDDSPILNITKDILKDTINGDGAVILSRDPHYQCIFALANRCELYDGKRTISANDFKRTEKYPEIIYSMVPYYYVLAGQSRNNYKRPLRWTKNKIIDYIMAHGRDIIEKKDEVFNNLEKEVKVFQIKELIEN